VHDEGEAGRLDPAALAASAEDGREAAGLKEFVHGRDA